MNRKSGEETKGGANPKGITCVILPHIMKLRDLDHLVMWMHYSENSCMSASGGKKFPSPLC